MKSLSVVATVIAAVLAFSVIPSAFANDMNAIIVPQTDKGELHYIGVKNITLRYEAGSAAAKAFGDEETRVTHTIRGNVTSEDSGVISAITAFNRALLDKGSPAQVTELRLIYTAAIKPSETSTLISYKIEVIPTMAKFVLGTGSNEAGASQLIDLEWRGILVNEPIMVDVPSYGEMDINRPMGLMQAVYPEAASQIESSQAAEIFDEPILDFRKFDQKMDTWHFLFDPSGSLVETSAFFREESGAKVTSIYSLGESSFREGTFEAEEKDAAATIDGSNVAVHSQVPAPSGQIQVAGFSNLDVSQADAEIASVSPEAPEGFTTATGGFPIQVLLILGGMMGAIAVFILWKARK
ncbi:MAG: hypothetical protein QXJ74_05435 [Nitrososphaera sp.]